jgi:hypothetical protein
MTSYDELMARLDKEKGFIYLTPQPERNDK